MPTTLVAAVDRFFDDASLFPPAGLPMAQALAAHARVREGPYSSVVGPFLCPAARLAELDACVASGQPRPAEIGVIAYDARTNWSQIYATPGLVQVEAPQTARLPEAARRVRRYLEIGSHTGPGALDGALDMIAASGTRAKVRCGGLTRDDVPTCAWLAAVLVGCAQRELKLKATAGLHHAFRQSTDNGPQHGFVNLLAAAAAAHRAAPVETVTDILAAEEDQAPALIAQVGRGRELLVSVGTCSIDEPVAELTERGLL